MVGGFCCVPGWFCCVPGGFCCVPGGFGGVPGGFGGFAAGRWMVLLEVHVVEVMATGPIDDMQWLA